MENCTIYMHRKEGKGGEGVGGRGEREGETERILTQKRWRRGKKNEKVLFFFFFLFLKKNYGNMDQTLYILFKTRLLSPKTASV